MTMVRALVHTIGMDAACIQVLDAHRRKRNAIEYSGEDAEPVEAQNAIAAARGLLRDVKLWLAKHHPELA